MGTFPLRQYEQGSEAEQSKSGSDRRIKQGQRCRSAAGVLHRQRAATRREKIFAQGKGRDSLITAVR
jgi:hypothetical protein